jgi:hypothetical protein
MASSDKADKKILELKEKETKRKNNPFVWGGSIVILVILVITFVAGPAIGQFSSGSGRVIFGTYNKKPIEYRADNYFARQRDSIADQVRDNTSTDPFAMEFQLYQVWRQAFESTALHVAFLDMADRAGLAVSDARVDREIISNGPYRDADGNFDESRYLSTSTTMRKANWDYTRESLIQDTVVRDIFSTSPTQGEIDFIKSMGSEEYAIRYASFPFSLYPSEEIISFAREKEDQFREIELSRIAFFDSQEEAEEVLNQVNENPLLFEELARNHSQDSFADKGGVMGRYAYHELSSFFTDPEDLDAVFRLGASEISGLVSTDAGWFIYRVDSPAATPDLNNPEVQARVLEYIQRYERGRIEDYLLARAEEVKASAEEMGLVQAALRVTEVHESNRFPLVYGNPSFSLYGSQYPLFTQPAALDGDSSLSGSSRNLGFLKALKSLKDSGDLTDPLILDSGVVLVELVERGPADENAMMSTEFYYTYAVNSWKESDLTSGILTSDKLKDNFYQVFGSLMSEN